MEHKLKKDKTQKYKKINAYILQVLLFVYLAVFTFGCDESSQTTSRDFNATNIGAPWSKALGTIQEGLADNDPLVRVRALEVVADTGQIRLMPQVHQLLHDKSMPVRFAAALAVGDLEYSPSKSSVSQLLKDSDANVTTAAAYAMTKLGAAQYLEALFETQYPAATRRSGPTLLYY